MKYTYPSTLDDVVLEYIYGHGGLSPKPEEWWLAFSCTFGRETSFGNEYTYPSTLSDVVSEYIRLWGSISKTLGVVACFFLYLQEGYTLWKWNILIQVP